MAAAFRCAVSAWGSRAVAPGATADKNMSTSEGTAHETLFR